MKTYQKRLLPLLLVFVLLFSLSAFADEKKAEKVDKKAIGEELVEMGFIKGHANGELGTEENLKREQAIVILARLQGLEAEAEKFEGKSKFEDIKVEYYKPFINYAFDKGWVKGRSETVFGYGDNITRDEFALLIMRSLGYEGYTGEEFKKVGEDAEKLGMLKDVELEAKDAVLRGDAFLVIKNSFGVAVKDDKNAMTLYERLTLKKFMEKKEDTIIITHTNDMHGFFVEGKYDGMGLAKVARFNELVKAANPHALYLDAGDAIQGANLVTLSKGKAAIKMLNTMNIDAAAVGNHEFDYGSDTFLALEKEAKYPFYACNVKNAKKENIFKPYVIKEVAGKKVAIIGIATPETAFKSHPDNTKGITFEDPVVAVKAVMAELKGKADYFVAVAHLGDEVGDVDYTSVKLAKEVPELDVIVDGHSHSTYPEGKEVNGVMIVSAGEKTKNVGYVEINKDGKVTATLFDKKSAMYISEVADVAKVVAEVVAENKKIEDEVVAEAPELLVGERTVVRKGESNLGNLLTAALKDVSKADFALTNGGGIRASIEKGKVTKGNILTVLPFGNTVRVIQISGKDVRAAIEHGLSKYPEENGGFPHIAGLTVKFDPSKDAGSRITEILVNGKDKLDDAKMYTLATNDFLVAGGDGYAMLKQKVVAEFGAMDEILINYVNTKGFGEAKTDERIKAVK